jgi:hypothetical protein
MSNYDMTGMNIIVALVLLLCAGLCVAWARSPRLRAWIEKPNYNFQRDAQAFDRALKAATIAEGRKTL